jgi:hypothetical protein
LAGDADKLSLLHDHYKETFALIRERETQRDRLFLWLLVIFALLVIEIQYPANFNGVLGHVNVAGNNIDLQQLPLARLLNVSWVFTAALVLKYCQVAKAVERQYTYLHLLEDRISDGLGDTELYRREGRAYREQYPHLLNWAWVYYTILFSVGNSAWMKSGGYLVLFSLRVYYPPWPKKPSESHSGAFLFFVGV